MGVRGRITAFAVGVVGLALVVGSVAMVVVLRQALTNNVRTALELRAEDVAASLKQGEPSGTLAVEDLEDSFVQAVDADGRVVASSSNIKGEPPAAPGMGPGQNRRVKGLAFDDDEFLVVTAEDTGPITVMAGQTLEEVTESTDVVTRLLLVGVPLLLFLVAGLAWWLVGLALAPMHAARDRQRRFISDAGHELRSPIATIRQHSEVALAHPETTPTGELAETTLAESLRLQEMVDGLLFLARSDEGALPVANDPVDLDDVVFAEAQRFDNVDTRGVSGGQLRGDAPQLARMVRNLLENAVRHARSQVAVALTEDGHAVVLTVDDDGPGVPLDERERVFERFVRLDEARARGTGGTGLGLAIVAEVVRVHGGTVVVGNSPFGGARFTIQFRGGSASLP